MLRNALLKKNQNNKNPKRMRQCLAALLAAVLTLGTTAGLAPSAFAQEQNESFIYTCGLEEHSHTAECYEKVTSVQIRTLTCSLEEQSEEAAVIIVHKHGAECYAEDGTLVCPLEEREAHSHGSECYTSTETPVCEFADAAPAEHTHTEECYTTTQTLVCEFADGESEEHTHTEECYTTTQTLVCQPADDGSAEHTHTEECYLQFSCEREELALHSHTPECGDGCTIPVVVEHNHTDACFTTTEVPAEDLEQLTCGKEEDAEHVHTDLCYGTWELKCGLEVHTHNDECPREPIDFTPGEQASGTNWMAGRGEGNYIPGTIVTAETNIGKSTPSVSPPGERQPILRAPAANQPSSVQIHDRGGANSTEDQVSVTKTIAGTQTENVFDITLRVDTKTDIQRFLEKPDMAVVIVMDISKTMDSDFGSGTRYDAAMDAAEVFVDLFAGNTSVTSKLGFVAFNTNAHKIMGLQPVNSAAEAKSFSASMKRATDSIMDRYTSSDPTRFTNIEAGLAMAGDWLDGENSANKFILFLSDGMPTTYIKSGYTGYVPENRNGNLGSRADAGKDGVFYDGYNGHTMWTTNYSDKGAVRARREASALKAKGISIFSAAVGMDEVDSFLYSQLVTRPSTPGGVSTVDCPIGTTGVKSLEVGSSFENWLKTAIASNNQYIHCDNPTAMERAYREIFNKFKQISIENSAELWTVVDRIPSGFEFIAFHDQRGSITDGSGNLHTGLSGSPAAGKENTISRNGGTLTWNLKQSGFRSTASGNTTDYTYSVTYRVRLKNEAAGFLEKDGTNQKIYPTNESAVLTYNTVKTVNGVPQTSGKKTVAFAVPSVVGYLGELEFTKQDQDGNALPGATFTLSHNTTSCSTCRGDGKAAVTVANMTAVSDANGKVKFTNIPSGHIYTLRETGVPNGYAGDNTAYTVSVTYDRVTAKAGDKTLTTVVNRALETTTEIVGTKYLTNPDGAEHTFTFEMVEVDQNGTPIAGATPVRKTVTYSGDSSKKDQSFRFDTLTYKASDLGGAASRTYYYKVTETEQDTAGMNADETYYIVQVDVNLASDGSGLTATQTIYRNGMETKAPSISFTNTLLGELRVTKEFLPLEGETVSDRAFAMKVTITGPDIRSGMEYTVNGQKKTASGTSLEIDVSLKHGDTAVIGQIPSGSRYSVEEVKSSAYGYHVSYDAESSGTIPTKTTETPCASVKVINTKLETKLVIEGTKRIANPNGEKYTYVFRLTEADSTGKPIADGVTQEVSLQLKDEAKFSFELDYQSTMMAGSTDGIRTFYYLIEEITADDGLTVDADETIYLVKVALDGRNNQLSAQILDYSTIQGTTVTSADSVTFTNTLLGSLNLSKKIIGEYPDGETFSFTIVGLPNGEYAGALNKNPYAIKVVNGAFTINLAHEDSLVIYGIPHGTKVIITEAASEYTVRYVVNSGWQHNGNQVTAEITTKGTTVLFRNHSPYGLPQTGQLSWPIPVLAILGLICVGGGIFLYKKKEQHET